MKHKVMSFLGIEMLKCWIFVIIWKSIHRTIKSFNMNKVKPAMRETRRESQRKGASLLHKSYCTDFGPLDFCLFDPLLRRH